MGRGTNGEAPLKDTRCAGAELVLQSNPILRGENRRKRLVGTGEKPMDDLDAERAVVQSGERIDEPLSPVVALKERGQIHLGIDAIALVVHDQAVLTGSEEIEDPRDERRGRESKGMLAVQAGGGDETMGEVGAAQPEDEPGDLPQILPPERYPQLPRNARDIALAHLGTGEVEVLEEAVDDAPAEAPAGTLGGPLGKAQDTFEVVAVAAALEL
jgi:hypothetical protein